MDDDADDNGNGNYGDGATVQRKTPSYDVVVDDDADDHCDGDNGNGATVQRCNGRRRRRRTTSMIMATAVDDGWSTEQSTYRLT